MTATKAVPVSRDQLLKKRSRIERRQRFDLKVRLGRLKERRGEKAVKPVYNPVSRQNHKPVRVHVDERHHHCGLRELGLRQLLRIRAAFAVSRALVFFGVLQRRFVAVMTVSDDELFVAHGCHQQAYCRGVVHPPEPVLNAVFVGDFGVGCVIAFVENLFHAAGRVGVEHEDLAEVRLCGFQQVQPIALGLRQRLFVTKDDLVGIFMQLAQCDKPAPFLFDFGPGNLETLGVCKHARLVFLDQNALLAPGTKILCRAGIDVFTLLCVK